MITIKEHRFITGHVYECIGKVSANNNIAVPEGVVVRSGSKKYVFVEKHSKQFEMTPVQRIVSEDNFVAISSEDTNLLNETIIKKNAYAALMKVKNTGEEEE